jgi:ferredoxin
MKITVDEEACIGSGQCVRIEPEVFDQRSEDGVVRLLEDQPSPERHSAVLKAARTCPSGAIRIEL